MTFRYRPDRPEVLKDVNVSIAAGEVLGVVGPSGSGKSTLAKLVQRLHTPERGRVLVDGVDLGMVDPAWLRRQVGVVLQENILFNRSVRENIALADPAMAIEQVVEAAKMAGAHEFILELPEAYDTRIDERGGNLSGGQRQRMAIARALAINPRILIFDEATSALDAESEEIIQTNLKAMTQGRTVIIIAHRLSAVRQADRIITLERGAVVEAGSHADLLTRGGALCLALPETDGRSGARDTPMNRHVDILNQSLKDERARGKRPNSRSRKPTPACRLEILESPPNPAGRLLLWIILAFAASAIVWGSLWPDRYRRQRAR